MKMTRVLILSVLFNCILLQFASVAKSQPVSPHKEDLASVIRDADEIRILAPVSREVLHTFTGGRIGAEFLSQFAINEEAPHFHCMCYGDAWLEFRAANTVKALVGFHHAQSI